MDLTIKFILDSDSLKEPRDHQLTHMNQLTDSYLDNKNSFGLQW